LFKGFHTMTTAVSICSNALMMLGKAPIASLEDESDRASYCANLYPALRDSLLRKHFWNCAIKRVLLSPTSEAPGFDYSHQFQLPSDFLRLYQVGTKNSPIDDFQLENRMILANVSSLPLRYVWRNEDENNWDTGLVQAATHAMAAMLAYPIVQSTSLRESMLQTAKDVLREAKAIDGQENPGDTFGEDFPLIRGRY
jgi:hypothetical protein